MDDIVERLREEEYVCCGEHYERDAYCRSCVLHAEASAEIERLRTENNYFANCLERMHSSIGETLKALDAWKEARRG